MADRVIQILGIDIKEGSVEGFDSSLLLKI